jgi:hypothetical protein
MFIEGLGPQVNTKMGNFAAVATQGFIQIPAKVEQLVH